MCDIVEERPLKDYELPLIVQLNWGKDDREGRFLLKKETDPTVLVWFIGFFIFIFKRFSLLSIPFCID